MVSPSSASPTPPSLGERPAGSDESSAPATGATLVADLGSPLADAYAKAGRRANTYRLGRDVPAARVDDGPVSLIVFLPERLDDEAARRLGALIVEAARRPVGFVGIVSTFRVHLDDPEAERAERVALDLLATNGLDRARIAVFRPGHVLAPGSEASRWVKRLSPLFPLFSARVRTCFVEGDELFAFIDAKAEQVDVADDDDSPGRPLGNRRREYTLLGPNVSWRSLLEARRGDCLGGKVATAASRILSWLQVGQVGAVVVGLAGRWSPGMRSWWVETIKPRSMREIVSLCHRGNIDRVRVVGYNNGVNHFGQRHPGKTVVSTVRCNRTASAYTGVMKADSGATIKAAKDFLGGRGEELYVMPNYSYVAIGTSFFVPIHGSAVDYATVADTALRAVLYDPDADRIVSATREDAAFRDNLYNPRSRVVLLRLHLRTRPRSSYFVRRETVKDSTAGELLAALCDEEAANVEIRQGNAASDSVTISRYYTEADGPSGPALESPRDALGRLWDRLEENPVTSFLMHATSRHVAWHTELFLTPEQFERFWPTHAKVPLRKIQLRFIHRDGMPNSPFRDEGCVSADLFLFRTDKPAFDAYVAEHIPDVRCNPGKHSN